MRHVELVGGPLCGMRMKRKTDPGLFIWTEGRRCYKQAAKGRRLYRRLEPKGEVVLYLHIGTRVGHCEECGAFDELASTRKWRCSMCGGTLVGDR